MSGSVRDSLPRCVVSELPRLLCHHCDSFTMTPAEQAYLRGEFGSADSGLRPSGPVRVVRIHYPAGELRYGAPASGPGQSRSHVPAVLFCDHGRPPGSPALCRSVCLPDFERALGDVPGYVADLEIARDGEAVFLDQGARPRPTVPPGEDDPLFVGPFTEEASLPVNLGASRALGGLWRAFAGDPTTRSRYMLANWRETTRRHDLAAVARRVTEALVVAHRVIDRPPTLLDYGVCPKCGNRIKQERVDPDDPDAIVKCPCGYGAPVRGHFAAQLELGQDQHYTITELLRVLEQGGEPTTMHAIKNLIYRRGLPRERGQRSRWVRGRLERYEVDVFRLGDVRAMLADRRAAG